MRITPQPEWEHYNRSSVAAAIQAAIEPLWYEYRKIVWTVLAESLG